MEARSKRKGVRNHGRSTVREVKLEVFTISEMFEMFMWFKNTEGLSERTITEYHQHFKYLTEWLDEDLPKEEITLEVFREWVDFMETEKGLKPMTVNIRIRTMRAFVRWCFLENMIEEPIHEKFKPKRVPEDTIEALSMTEIKSLMNAFNDSIYDKSRHSFFFWKFKYGGFPS